MNFYSDRSWMARRKSSAQIGATPEFRAGCLVFLDYAYSHPGSVNGQNKIRCPCLKCKNCNYLDRDMVNYHLLVSGFMRNYEECWWAHGQRRDGGITPVHNPDSESHHGIHTSTDCVRAICADRTLLSKLVVHLGVLSPEELTRAVAATTSQHRDGYEGDHHEDCEDGGES